MNGRVLSEYDLTRMVERKTIPLWVSKSDLLATIRDRDKTIAEKEESRQSWRAVAQFRDERIQALQHQNTILREALEYIRDTLKDEYIADVFARGLSASRANEALAKVN